jgi:hypothetical protein
LFIWASNAAPRRFYYVDREGLLEERFILIAKSLFFFTPHPDPLPQGEREIIRKELLAIAIYPVL